MAGEPQRTRAARAAAEAALVRIAYHFEGTDIPLVVLGGLVPELLCSSSDVPHQGTTDIDIQINLEVEVEGEHAGQLERALLAAGFVADPHEAWRWRDRGHGTAVKVEFLCDLDDQRANDVVLLRGAQRLGAANLRGTGYAARDWTVHELHSAGGEAITARIRFAALAGYLVAKAHALRERRLDKDMYDLAFVLLHNAEGGPTAAASLVMSKFGDDLPRLTTMFREVAASFSSPSDTGPSAYAQLAFENEPESEPEQLAADAYAALSEFIGRLYP